MSSLYPSMYFILAFFTEKLNSLIVEKPTTKAKDSFKKHTGAAFKWNIRKF